MNANASTSMQHRAVVVGVIAIALGVVGAWWDRSGFFRGYFIAWLFLLGITLGSMTNLMIHDLTGGRWGAVLRPPLEAAAATMPLVALLALPLALGLPDIFAWARPDVVAASTVLQAKQWYLNTPFFLLRAVVLLAGWSLLSIGLRRDWRARRSELAPAGQRHLSIVGLFWYFIGVTVAAIDWIASLTPEWYSTAIGLRVGVSQTTAAFAYAVPAAAWLVHARIDHPDAARDRNDLGNLLLMFVMLWAYIAFTQFLIIWAEDLPHEIAWFLPRGQTSWRGLAIVVLIMEFALPMIAMLFRGIKRNPIALATVCLIVLVGQWLDVLWLVAPAFHPVGFNIQWQDVLAILGLGGLWLAFALATLDRAPPVRLPNAEAALNG